MITGFLFFYEIGFYSGVIGFYLGFMIVKKILKYRVNYNKKSKDILVILALNLALLS